MSTLAYRLQAFQSMKTRKPMTRKQQCNELGLLAGLWIYRNHAFGGNRTWDGLCGDILSYQSGQAADWAVLLASYVDEDERTRWPRVLRAAKRYAASLGLPTSVA
jgi:hypothetical protein